LFDMIAAELDAPESTRTEWAQASRAAGTVQGVAVGATSSPSMPFPVSMSDFELDGLTEPTRRIGKKLVALTQLLRLSLSDETRQLAGLAGNSVDLDQVVSLDIGENGAARVTYRHELFNMTGRPVTRFARELWFETTSGRLAISPTADSERRLAIQRTHDTSNLAKFACQISPPILPGETAVVGYVCDGGHFIEHHYWRQAIPRFTRQLTISLRHRSAGRLVGCTAVEEHPDGAENSATDGLVWDYDGDDVVITLPRDYLRPNQAVTLRWEVSHAPA